MREIEFELVDSNYEITFGKFAVAMVAYFECLRCSRILVFYKPYNPVPMHYESLLSKCRPVTCPKCGLVHQHDNTDPDFPDAVIAAPEFSIDPNQLSLFQ